MELIIIGIVALIIGAAIGFFLGKKQSNDLSAEKLEEADKK